MDVRICPTCGTRNKPKWEFCVSCGEPLQDVSVTMPMIVSPVAAASAPAVEIAAPRAGPSPLGLVAGLALAAAAGYILWQWTRHGSAPAEAVAFAIPTAPRITPPPTPAQEPPGEDDYQEGIKLLARGDGPGAAERLARAVGAAPSSALYHDAYGKALSMSGNLAGAIAEFEEAVRIKPEMTTYLMDLGNALERAGKSDAAMAAYDRLLALAPSSVEGLRSAARLNFANAEKALPYLRRLAEMHPVDAVVQQQFAYGLEKTGDLAGA